MKISPWNTAVIIMILNIPVEPVSILKEMITQKDPSLIQTADSQNDILDFVRLVKQHGYPVEEHRVVTEDGYFLTLHRISDSPRSNNTRQNKTIVYLQHGLFTAVETFIILGPKNSLAFLLADAGFDVWLGSLRGSTYGQLHRKFSITDKEFWDFSYHEHAIYDLPALIDYVLEYTNSKKLNYIGFSMGTTISYVLLSIKPSYNDKFQLVISLAPVAYWVKASINPIIKLGFKVSMDFKAILDAEGIYGIVPQSKLTGLVSQVCSDKSILQFLCLAVVFSVFGNDPVQLNSEIVNTISKHYPGGGSFLSMYQYIQNFNTGKFQAYDYGYEENIKRYNQKTPPEYDLKKISAPVALVYGKNDGLVSIQNIMELYKRLPNVSIAEAVPYKYFTHADFVFAKDVKKLLNDRIIYLLNLCNN